jgi:hypothetical protein
MLEPCLVMRGGLASKACGELQRPHTRTDSYTANRFVELLRPIAGVLGVAVHLISSPEACFTMSSPYARQSEVQLKVLDGKSQE